MNIPPYNWNNISWLKVNYFCHKVICVSRYISNPVIPIALNYIGTMASIEENIISNT